MYDLQHILKGMCTSTTLKGRKSQIIELVFTFLCVTILLSNKGTNIIFFPSVLFTKMSLWPFPINSDTSYALFYWRTTSMHHIPYNHSEDLN